MEKKREDGDRVYKLSTDLNIPVSNNLNLQHLLFCFFKWQVFSSYFLSLVLSNTEPTHTSRSPRLFIYFVGCYNQLEDVPGI